MLSRWASRKFCYFNPFQNKPWFLCVCQTSLLKTQWEKEKLLIMSNFSFPLHVFYPFRKLSAIFIKFKNCRLQTLSIRKSLKLVIWERVDKKSHLKNFAKFTQLHIQSIHTYAQNIHILRSNIVAYSKHPHICSKYRHTCTTFKHSCIFKASTHMLKICVHINVYVIENK